MLSSQRLWPRSCSFLVAFIVPAPTLIRASAARGRGPGRSWVEKIADAFNGNIGGRKGADRLGIAGIATLLREDGRHAVLPEALDRRQDAQLVVDQDVVFAGKRRSTSSRASSLWI